MQSISADDFKKYGFELDQQQKIVNAALVFTLGMNNSAQYTVMLSDTFSHNKTVCRLAYIQAQDPHRDPSSLEKYKRFVFVVEEDKITGIVEGYKQH